MKNVTPKTQSALVVKTGLSAGGGVPKPGQNRPVIVG